MKMTIDIAGPYNLVMYYLYFHDEETLSRIGPFNVRELRGIGNDIDEYLRHHCCEYKETKP